MPRSSRTPARRRRRSIAAAISGLAIGVAGVGIAALPAVADPTDGGGAPPATAGPSPAAVAGGTRTVTLITGDRVRVTDLPDGTHTVDVESAVPGAAVQTVEVAGDLHVLPQAAMPYLAAGVVDRDLFNVSQLIEYGYDDASVSATPVIVEFADGPAAFSAPLPGVEIGAALESIGGAAATADHATAASTWSALTAASGVGTFSSEVSLAGGIEAIHLDGKVQATLDSSVPWIGAPEAWADGYTGAGVTVAVLDTGYDDTHPDLAGRVLAAESASFVPSESDPASDLHGHGTHVASTIAGSGAASGGTHRGVADGADLLVGKVLGADGSGQDSWIIEAMQWAGERADIVSMSLGSSQPSDGTDVMSEALDAISEETGALFVVAAGNNGAPEAIGAPGAAAQALTVGSVEDPTGALSYFSNQGPLAFSGALKPELVAPGSDVTAARSSDSPGEGAYVGMSGTSMATPHVAGAAAILKSQHPEYTADQLRAALISTATDVGLTSYQGGSGVVDVDSAVDAGLIASGSGDFGMLAWGEEAEPVVRTIEYANRGAAEVVLDLAASLDGAAEGVLAMDVDELTIPAGESRSVELTVDPAKVEAGTQLSGTLVASVDGAAVARTALGTIAEQERYDLTVTATGFDGEPIETYALLYDVAADFYVPFLVSGETTMRLPGGEYAVIAYMSVDHAADESVTVLVGDPDLVLDGDAEVAFDARAAKPVTVDVGDDGVEPWFSRLDLRADAFSSSYLDRATSDGFYAQPMTAPNADEFSFTSRWRLQQPMLSLTADKEQLDLITQAGSTIRDATFKAGAVDVGTGSAAEFAAVKATGEVAVVTRSNEVSPSARAANALAAGAVALLVVNDADGEFNEWVGSEDYFSEVDLPVASVSGVQGRRLLESIASKKVTISGESEPAPEEAYDILRYSDGSVPEDLDYRPRDLARVDTTFHGRTGELVGEFRWDFDPATQYSLGMMLRTERGITRTDWVNTDQVEWNQGAMLIAGTWEVRDMRRAYEPGSVSEATFYGPIVRPFVGPGYWAPERTGAFAQVNVPSWADGGSPHHTGAFDVFQPVDDRSQLTEVWVGGELMSSSPWQSASVFDIPDGTAEWRVLNTAVHDGTYLPSSTKTVTEWTFESTGFADDDTEQTLPMMQAYYDVEADAAGAVGSGRKAGAPVELGLELSHIEGADGMAELTGAALEMRVAGGDWRAVDLESGVAADDEATSPMINYPVGRPFLETYTAKLAVPDAGAWIDLRVTATDAAGNTFSQEIERAFEAAPSKQGAPHGVHGGRP
ncbi:PA domain-containing protein [Agromyces ramosus]|uniref:PA domain-containing protein n=1 Tax=Agromyces ramosus TaxID=33879 RepID=A0A4Q7MB64_9MICO|nr:S8 family serine peptidase [Agromyces ramosus]RZS64493.1 PA domain-containing protein [Agromyces ramosus]